MYLFTESSLFFKGCMPEADSTCKGSMASRTHHGSRQRNSVPSSLPVIAFDGYIFELRKKVMAKKKKKEKLDTFRIVRESLPDCLTSSQTDTEKKKTAHTYTHTHTHTHWSTHSLHMYMRSRKQRKKNWVPRVRCMCATTPLPDSGVGRTAAAPALRASGSRTRQRNGRAPSASHASAPAPPARLGSAPQLRFPRCCATR